MDSLYNISEELLSIFSNIEENGGEVTDEELELLNIKEEELANKLEAYKNYVLELKGDIEKCKCEEKRIHDNRKVRENRVEILKSRMLDAVKLFGKDGKNNKYFELPDCRIYTKTSNSINIDEDRVDILIGCIREFIKQGFHNGNNTIEEITSKINEIGLSQFNLSPTNLFTQDDILSIRINISKNYNFTDMIIGDYLMILSDIEQEKVFPSTFSITSILGKTDYKYLFDLNKDITLANQETNDSIIIK